MALGPETGRTARRSSESCDGSGWGRAPAICTTLRIIALLFLASELSRPCTSQCRPIYCCRFVSFAAVRPQLVAWPVACLVASPCLSCGLWPSYGLWPSCGPGQGLLRWRSDRLADLQRVAMGPGGALATWPKWLGTEIWSRAIGQDPQF